MKNISDKDRGNTNARAWQTIENELPANGDTSYAHLYLMSSSS